jgi:Domain of unknown function (DUF4112)
MTETIRVEAKRRETASTQPDAQRDLENVDRLAKLMDTEFEFAGIRFGLDALIGLIPVLGDSIAALIGLYPIYVAQQHKLGLLIRTRMLFNLIIDWLIGVVPIIGDILDVGFKANIRNAKLLRRALEKRPS